LREIFSVATSKISTQKFSLEKRKCWDWVGGFRRKKPLEKKKGLVFMNIFKRKAK